jgi:hypothetical protein
MNVFSDSKWNNPKKLNAKVNELADAFIVENGIELKLTQSMINDFLLSHEIIDTTLSYNLYGRVNKRIRDYFGKAKVIEIKKG